MPGMPPMGGQQPMRYPGMPMNAPPSKSIKFIVSCLFSLLTAHARCLPCCYTSGGGHCPVELQTLDSVYLGLPIFAGQC